MRSRSDSFRAGAEGASWTNVAIERLYGALVEAGEEDFHVALRGGDGGEAELLVEAVGIAGDEGEAAEALEIRVGGDGFHEPFGTAVAARGFEDVDIAEIGEGGEVAEDEGVGE